MNDSRGPTETSGAVASLSLQEIIRLSWNGKWYLIGCVAVSLLLGAGYLMKVEPTYKVNARLLVQEEGFPLERGARSRKDDEFLATQAEIIRSPAVVEQAATSLEPNHVSEGKSVVRAILGSLQVEPLTGTNVLSISFRNRDEAFAVRTVDAVISSYQKYLQEMDRDFNLHSLELLTESEKTLRNDLEVLQAKYRKIRKDSPLMGQGNEAAAVERSLLQNLGMSLSETRTKRIELENQLRIIKLAPAAQVALGSKGAVITPVSATTRVQSATLQSDHSDHTELFERAGSLAPNTREKNENLVSFRQQLAMAEIRLQTLVRHYGEKHPELKAVRQEVNAWKEILRDAVEHAPKMLERELAAIELQEQRLEDLYESEFEKAKVVDSHLLEEQQALDGIERVRMIHDSILTQVRELQLADQALDNGRSVVKVAILEAPALKHRPIWPKKPVLLAGCLAVGLMAGMGLIACFTHYSATTIEALARIQRVNLRLFD